ncbi:hypothetical protein [Mycobacterium sp. AZCC_0083]|uniref:hypothetical protein n=1 Tax=Mycobacterium sp. AZCC_0083 TaxID=2735882 RepID=UPI00161C37FE|nr:hypothetical protein [Mycobacterium sp. AZCC_0083]
MADVRLFVADETGGDLTELTSGGGPVVRFTAPDLQRAQRSAARLRAGGGDVAVILDLAVAVPGDFRAVGDDGTVRYAGTVDGLTGLIADIDSADVADGVALIPAAGLPRQDLRRLGHDVLGRLAMRGRASA